MFIKKSDCFLTILISIAIALFSCNQIGQNNEEGNKKIRDCENFKYGTIVVINSSKNPYDFYIDNQKACRIEAKSNSQPINISEGNGRSLYVEQISGYIFTPTKRRSVFNVVRCSEYTWNIP